jgi:glutathione synthase
LPEKLSLQSDIESRDTLTGEPQAQKLKREKMRWLVVLDPIEGLKSETDTSLALMRQARTEGIEVDTATIQQLYFSQKAMVLAMTASGECREQRLGGYDLIFMRKEPPYDLAFHYATQLLSLANTLVVNSPRALRDYNEKLIALTFARFMPSTLVGSDMDRISNFVREHGGGVIKELDSFQGRSVTRIAPGDLQTIAELTKDGSRPVMVQQFLDGVYAGDKRVLMLGDKVLGAVLRKPKKGYHANFANSDALATTLTEREEQILAELGPWLLEQGIHFTGLDLIGGYLTEINITCPTGIVQVSRLEKRSLVQEMVAYFRELAQNTKILP